LFLCTSFNYQLPTIKKILFLDRDGVLVIEPPIDHQLDSLEKLVFYPKVFQGLARIVQELDYLLVMVTNQDGLGTASFPEDAFWPAQNKIIEAFKNEGIEFHEIHVDRTFAHDNAPTRKPGTAMLTHFMNNSAYDLANSYVIGDRITDMQLAENLGAKGIYMVDSLVVGSMSTSHQLPTTNYQLITTDWLEIYRHLTKEVAMQRLTTRTAKVQRTTKETDILIELNLDGQGISDNHTGLGFFDHMLDQLARHSGCDLKVQVKGDLHIDEHHTIEDTAIALGEAFHIALGSKLGIERYGFCLPMDDCLAQVAIDFGGRNWLVWEAEFKREKIGEMPTEMFFHFFKSFTDSARCNLNVKAEGSNEHHKIEAIFKTFAKSIKMALKRDPNNMQLPSTKGVL
jgi:imidazoleglycerol-phosphate dehydratase / histidinol-phosphatase